MYSRNPLSMYFSEHVERILPTPHRNLDWLNHPLNQGLVGYWPLRRQFQTPSGLLAKDYSGNGNDGTINNGPVLVDDPLMGGVHSLDGVDDVITVPNVSAVQMLPAFTWMGWIYPTDISSDVINRRILAKYDDANNKCALGILSNNKALFASVVRGGVQTNVNTSVNSILANPAKPYHFAWTYDGSGGTNTRIIINGVNDLAGTSTAILPQSTATALRVGQDNASQGHYKGLICEVRRYNYVVSPENIKAHYLMGLKRL